ncbi:tripartite tricarboxylate transporter substrate binding protein [Roseomonas sp. CCTCC AB2023176]|uniref:tripartite tricarboxylate transporter substrate binding protein n=1 Tax=Roseomonas sp. CCTCC AB2023176 TaxID=3342640 RepID=UPI0035DFA066
MSEDHRRLARAPSARTGLSRRALGAALAAPAILPAAALAQGTFPSRPISLIVPFPAGGTTDVTMRALAEAASRRLPQPVIVQNMPGAGNILGAQAVARARPDGYTLTQLPASAVRIQILQRTTYDVLKDFTPVVHVTGYTFGAICRADRFPNGWADVIAQSKREPGSVSAGNTGANGTPHVAFAELASREGVEFNHVSYRGDADGAQAILGGHLDMMAGGSGLGTLVDGGQAKWLHVWTRERLRRWPQAPTLLELGYRDMVITSPYGIVGPAGMDPAATRSLQEALAAAVQDPTHLAALERFDMTPDYMDSAAYGTFLRTLFERESDLVRRLGLRAA